MFKVKSSTNCVKSSKHSGITSILVYADGTMQDFLTESGTVSNDFVAQSHQLGHLLYWHKHGKTSIQVRQEKSLRWLLINNTLQSIVELNHPEHLLFPHLQVLDDLWQKYPAPQRVLELGLGGGAIRDYLHSVHQDCQVISVENNPDIIHCYKRYFGGDHISEVNCNDAYKVLELDNAQPFDWIILDLFSELDAPRFLYQHKFYTLLRNALTEQGVLFINFIAEHESQLKQLEHLLIINFGKKPYIHQVPGYANHIIAIER
ncbi:spermidine synthase [Pseudoalteromonas luteoviolacea 2ta16]|uniref:Spermidine synthase n=2 Tax=Pseudoalteromonas TaxID=53246 RepID=V4J9S4_PSEL2|nr:spermidine synthase [Pseudoalteromonas luteoviolacea 2ta16]